MAALVHPRRWSELILLNCSRGLPSKTTTNDVAFSSQYGGQHRNVVHVLWNVQQWPCGVGRTLCSIIVPNNKCRNSLLNESTKWTAQRWYISSKDITLCTISRQNIPTALLQWRENYFRFYNWQLDSTVVEIVLKAIVNMINIVMYAISITIMCREEKTSLIKETNGTIAFSVANNPSSFLVGTLPKAYLKW